MVVVPRAGPGREGAVLREVLGARREDCAGLLQRVRVAFEEDARVCAAWLFGWCARGDDDALSDLDLTVVVSNDAVAAVAGGPFLWCAGGPSP